MDVFEDASETVADVMEYDTVERNSVNHTDEATAVLLIPSTQFRFTTTGPPIILSNTSQALVQNHGIFLLNCIYAASCLSL